MEKLLEKPLALRFADVVDAQEAIADQQRPRIVKWDAKIERKVQEIVASNGNTTTRETGPGQWDHGDYT